MVRFYCLGGLSDFKLDPTFDNWFDEFAYEHPVLFPALLSLAVIFLLFGITMLIHSIRRKMGDKNTSSIQVKIHLVGIEDVCINYGSLFVCPMPKKEGFIFRGWFLDSACTIPYVSNKPIKKELILYPKWEREVG